jgi:tripartite ATP-independent transporter DctM subunit
MKTPALKKPQKLLYGIENSIACVFLGCISLLPAADTVTRLFRSGIFGNSEYLRHLVLWITFLGAMITSREQNHLSLSVGTDNLPPRLQCWIRDIAALISAGVSAGLAWAAWDLYRVAFDPSETIGRLPVRAVTIILPVGFLFITVRFITAATDWKRSLLRASGVALAAAVGFLAESVIHVLIWPLATLLILSVLAGTPIFIVLGGSALLLFFNSAGSTAVIANEAYTMLTGPLIPTIPLFTLAGFILSESKSGERLVTFFHEWFGWLPGGTVIMATLICAFFTTFTGASGVTILALGGLLSVVLLRSGYPREFTEGLLTSTGSIGLLFPPSLPLILYGVVAQLNIKYLFIGGLLPGVLRVAMVAALGIRHDLKSENSRRRFNLRNALSTLASAGGEIAMPLVTLAAFFSGLTTLVESAALAVIYAFVLEVIIRKDIPLRSFPGVMLKAVPLIGGVLIILSVANGLSYFIVDAQIPDLFTTWCTTHITNKYLFLLLLNIALLVTGCFMDIFSAILVVVPLIIPLGEAFGLHPVHLAIIFIANLELGYMTPPVGLNLFMASYRFEVPVRKIYRYVIPFLVMMIVTVLLVTYIPWLTTGLLGLPGIGRLLNFP